MSMRGSIRLRSNLALLDGPDAKKRAWEMVPGDLAVSYRKELVHSRHANRRQQEEWLLYEPCSLCRRGVDEIFLEGCDRNGCESPLDPDRIREARHRFQAAREAVDAERLSSVSIETESEARGRQPLADAAEAVKRFLASTTSNDEIEEDADPSQELNEHAGIRNGSSSPEEMDRSAISLDGLIDSLALGQIRLAVAQVGEVSPANHPGLEIAINVFGAWLGREAWVSHLGLSGVNKLQFGTTVPAEN